MAVHTKDRQKGEAVSPTNTMRLIKSLGVTAAARKLGVSTTTLHKARRTSLVSRVVEVAAEGVIHSGESLPAPKQEAANGESRVMFLLDVPKTKAEIVERMAQALGAEFITV